MNTFDLAGHRVRLFIEEARKGETAADFVEVATALKRTPGARIVLHFQGEYLTAGDAEKQVQIWGSKYESEDLYPVFFQWDGSFPHRVYTHLNEIALFRFFTRTVIWTHNFLADRYCDIVYPNEGRGTGGPISTDKLDQVAAGMIENVNLRNGPNIAKLKLAIEMNEVKSLLRQDPDFNSDVETIEKALRNNHNRPPFELSSNLFPQYDPDGDEGRGGFLTFPLKAATTMILGPVHLALYCADAVFEVIEKVLERLASGRDHGLYSTIIEEVLRNFYPLGRAGAEVREQMRKRLKYLFDDEIGQAFLHAGLGDVRLAAHGLGVEAVESYLLNNRSIAADTSKFPLALVAPTVDPERLVDILNLGSDQINRLLMLGLEDPHEKSDALLENVYPRSWLYFTSGVLDQQSDSPLEGMQRFNMPPFTDETGLHPWSARRRNALADMKKRGVHPQILWCPRVNLEAERHADWVTHPACIEAILNLFR